MGNYINIYYKGLTIKKMDVKTIFTFKALDSFMEDHKKNSATYIELYDRKIKLLEMVDQSKIDGNKYHALC